MGPTMQSPLPPSRIILRTTFALLLVYGCWLVLAPFAPAIFFAIAIVVSTWPVHAWLLSRIGQRRTIGSLLSCSLVAIAVIVPIGMLFVAFRDAAAWLLAWLDEWNAGSHARWPAWLQAIPWIGGHLESWGNASSAGLAAWVTSFGDGTRRILVATVRAFGSGIGQIALAALLLFALYKDGDRVGRRLAAFVADVGGEWGRESLQTVHRTIVAVMLGVLGTALAQAVVAIGGFALAGVPNAFLLGALTFVLSMAPVGPPLVWGGAALWLMREGQPGWSIFMLAYGVLGISLIDNVIKPLLISRSSRLPFAMTLMGVVGGMLAFGVAGIFIGPALLAVAIDLGRQWAHAGGDVTADSPPREPLR